jgi:hypothetical protein
VNEQVSKTEKKFDQQIDILKGSLSQSNATYKNLERDFSEERHKSETLASELNITKVKEKTLTDVY